MAKPASTKKSPAKKEIAPKKEPNAAQPAFKWQMGGLIAGIIVAIISTTEPGQQVREPSRERGRTDSSAPCVPAASVCLVFSTSLGMHKSSAPH